MRHYDNALPYARFPLGGIGTGTVSLNASGKLTDFQIFNRPALGMLAPYTFFALRGKWAGCEDARVLEAPSRPDYHIGRGYHPSMTMGLPLFASSRMSVRYPFATVDFQDDALPLRVTLTAFTPFIPSRADDSGIPGAVFHYDVENVGDSPCEALIAASMGNIHNLRAPDMFDNPRQSSTCRNTALREDGASGVFMTGDEAAPDALGYANNAILTPDAQAELRPYWYRGGWYDGLTDFWTQFCRGVVEAPPQEVKPSFSVIGNMTAVVGTVGVRKTIAPRGKARFTFVLSWYVPNRVKGWFEQHAGGQTMKNYYASLYNDAWEAGRDLTLRLGALEEGSRRFTDALYASALPEPMLDAIASNISVLRSNTCWRAPDGALMAWEGCHEQHGSCHGTCTHVWNYAQTVAWLFPALEQSARLNEFLTETNPDGKMTFRSQRRFGLPDWGMYPAIDGQFGTIVRAWREWKLGGDRQYLQAIYPALLRAFDFCMAEWDKDGDGVPEARQHNTYDIEFFGVNPLSCTMELAAIRAVGALAAQMGDDARAQAMDALFDKAQARFIALCWQGEYFKQAIDDPEAYPYQFGEGCLSDQLFGQTMAYLCGLGDLLPQALLDAALDAVYRHNFLTGDRRGACTQRVFVHTDEPGLALCTWPEGGKPRFPFPYSDEVWTGIEYQVATLMCYRGMTDKALEMVKAVRARYDGARRSPWAEIECGFYYTRAMASWGLLIALSGFDCNVARQQYTFAPRMDGTFFWSVRDAWGAFDFNPNGLTIRPQWGEIQIGSLCVPRAGEVSALLLDGAPVGFTCRDGALRMPAITLRDGEELRVVYG